ncbi:MAG: hypothetical protein RMK57_08440 [Bryobacterales bacterium]|nr:hypothetical protein [Bryobacteraceae bacterium]MDW8354544.1 hypothetical protein [Bryobacterales bacterium]
MALLATVEKLLWIASGALCTLLAWRLYGFGLHRRYPWFTTFLIANFAQAVVSALAGLETSSYAWIYLISQPIIWFLYIVITLEIYALVLRDHPGIATVGRRTMLAGLAIAVGVSALTLPADLQRKENVKILMYYGVIERGISFSLVVFLMLILLFLARYPVPLKRNIAVHAIVFSVFFLSSSLSLFVMNVTGFGVRRIVSTALLAIANACLLAWLLLLSPAGEQRTVVLRQRLAPDDEGRLLEQLEALNASLSRIVRK